MKATILTIGDEILVGQTIDTNSTYIAKELRKIGFSIFEIRSISDKKEAIKKAISELSSAANMVFITGGLGPTKDDITKKVLCEYFDDHLVKNETVLKGISDYFASINRKMLPVHYKQADLPSKARIVLNELGTASGMWFQKDGKHFISMPGVPYEMKGLMQTMIPDIKSMFNIGEFYHRTIHFQGIGESTLAKELSDIEEESEKQGISMAYLPSVGLVKIRFTGKETDQKSIETYIKFAKNKFEGNYFGEENTSIEEVIGDLLKSKKMTLGTVESCTSGKLAARIAGVPGASAYYEGSLITYSYTLKSKLAGVNEKIIKTNGAVSEAVITEMAVKGRKKLDVDYCIATSGIAGPGGGIIEKPVGTVWVGLATKQGVTTKKFLFKQNRERNIELTILYALNMLRKELLEIK